MTLTSIVLFWYYCHCRNCHVPHEVPKDLHSEITYFEGKEIKVTISL